VSTLQDEVDTSLPSKKSVKPQFITTLVFVQLAIYGVIAWLAPLFGFYAAERERPLLLVVSLLLVNFILHLWSLAILLKSPDSRNLGWRIALVAFAMRLILIGSTPIQEVDIYRYIWDGIVATQGISPFRYPPLAIADKDKSTCAPELQRLRSLVAQDAGIRETLHRVHFSELPTVYPTTSQFVFAGAAMVTPADTSVTTRLLIMKSWIVAFDLGALGLIWLLLRRFGKHSAWLIAWGWSPLVLKEFANSGHLDSIAVFFTLAATYVLAIQPTRRSLWASGLLMGLAVASKLYPVILLLLWIVAYSKRTGWPKGIQLATIANLTSFALLLPMAWDRLPRLTASPSGRVDEVIMLERGALPTRLNEGHEDKTDAADQGSLHGLSTFLTRWEMNDLLFMIVEENIRPADHVPNQPSLWFVVVPATVRQAITGQLAIWSGQPEDRIPFLTTRAFTAVIFGIILVWLACQVWREPEQLPQWMFLALAWFWFLSPTQNPWYWCWALAFVPFANSRVWLGVSGLSLIYYLRFWFLYQFPDVGAAEVGILGTAYRGTSFFDFVVVWLEFGPFLLLLALTRSLNRVGPRLAWYNRGPLGTRLNEGSDQ
jgi:hypothetical protein